MKPRLRPTGTNPGPAPRGKLARTCPTCGAAPGWRCGRAITYKHIPDGPVWKPIKEPHKDR